VKTISIALKAHFEQPYQRTATCWKVTLQSGTVKAFTDHDQDIVFDGTTYLASSGYVATNIASNDQFSVDTMNVQGMLVSPAITEDDLRAGRWDHADVEIFLVNWSDLTQGRLLQRVGKLSEVSVDRSRFVAEILGLTDAFRRVVGELTSSSCRASLGDTRCGVNLAPFTVTGTVTGVNDDGVTIYDTSRAEVGPAGGVDITQITADNPAEIQCDPVANLHSGMVVTITGVTTDIPQINTVWRITKIGEQAFTVPFDATGMAGTISNEGTVTPLGAESGYFDFGKLTWLTGNNADLSMEVKAYQPGQITLALPMPYEVQAGDTYSLIAGCDKQLSTCSSKYNNVTNFRGEPYVPGTDKIVQVARRG
jgi:uncharacterized phage protein (TIGR02218 family)